MKKRWVITADSGKNNMIVVWDVDTASPYKTIFKLPPEEIVSMDISKDCNFIATLSNKLNDTGAVISQKITIWEWKDKTEQIFVSDFFDHEGEVYHLIRFNPNIDENKIELLINDIQRYYSGILIPQTQNPADLTFP